MAKERADKPRKEKAEKAEKKVSQDKVKKHKKDKKPKREDNPEASSIDINIEETSAAPAGSSPESPATAPKPQYKDKKEKRRKEKKQKKAEKELKKKSKKGAIEAAVEEGASSADASGTVELPVRPASKGSDGDADADAEDGGAPLFTIDVNPGLVVPKVLEEKPEPMDEDGDEEQREKQNRGPQKTNPPSGLNRQARRRIRMIEEQREKIQKQLGVVAGGPDMAEEVQEQLDKWVRNFDDKSAMRMEKKRLRKEKGAARLRNKRGKLLTGRRLTERKKELQKMAKTSRRQGLSAPVATTA
ncbi:hypothetical protein Hte_006114 [Hypoxylon texense]